MTHGYRNIFGEERIGTPLFQTGVMTIAAIMTDWFFGSTIAGAAPDTFLRVVLKDVFCDLLQDIWI